MEQVTTMLPVAVLVVMVLLALRWEARCRSMRKEAQAWWQQTEEAVDDLRTRVRELEARLDLGADRGR